LVEFAGDGDVDSDGHPDAADTHPADAFNGFDLREAGTDGVFDTPDDDVYTLIVSPAYSSGVAVELFLVDGPLQDGSYRLTITDSLTDRVDNAFDGDGNDVAGGDFVRHFFVANPDDVPFEGRNNDSIANSAALNLSEGPVGSGFFQARGFGSFDPAGESDYWSFVAQAGDLVSVSVDYGD